MSSSYLVTGAAGFIGSHIAETLVKQGERVKVLDNFVTGKRENLAPFLDHIELIEGDLRNPADVSKAVDEINGGLGHHYSVAYVADHSGDGKAYSIEVRIPDHPHYQVDYRTGYVDQPAAVRSGRRMRSTMLFGADANPLGLRVELGDADSRFRLGAAGSKRITVPIQVKIPYGRLEMIQRGDIYWSKLWITLFAEDGEGNQSALSSHEQPITVEADRYQEAVAKGFFSYHTGVEIEGGEQKVFIGVQEELSGRTSIMPIEFDN